MSAPRARSQPGIEARRVAVEALVRIERDGAYANLVLGPLLERSGLEARDRALVTELVYGVTRMQRACDWLVDRFVSREPDPVARAALRLGAYQLVFAGTPPHAAVSSVVEVVPAKARGFVNAVLRRVATAGVPDDDEWPTEAVRLSYPDWIVAWATDELGSADGPATLEHQNLPPSVTTRPDGYTQDQASQWVTALADARSGQRVLDVCAAPGGKATGLAATGATVVAVELSEPRAGLVAANARRTRGHDGSTGRVLTVVGDGRRLPVPAATFDRVLVDAPCSGLGVLRRRADARWRIEPDAVARLADLQRSLLEAAMAAVVPGGVLVYAVCTLTRAETEDVDGWLGECHPEWEALDAPGSPWETRGRGARLLPHRADTDGMYVLRLRRPPTDVDAAVDPLSDGPEEV